LRRTRTFSKLQAIKMENMKQATADTALQESALGQKRPIIATAAVWQNNNDT
jgi:hypothetical protein